MPIDSRLPIGHRVHITGNEARQGVKSAEHDSSLSVQENATVRWDDYGNESPYYASILEAIPHA